MPSLFNCRHLGHQVLPRSWLHWLSCPEHGASSCASVWSSAGGDQRVVQSPTCSPASASPSPSFGDAFLAAVWCLSSSAVSYLPPTVPLSMCLRSGLWESSGTTSNLHCECVRHPVASDVQNHVCFSTAVSKRASLGPRAPVSCGSMRGTEASCFKKHVNLALRVS